MNTRLAIHGMTCASCVGHVAQALQRVAGVDAVQVNLATEEANIEHGGAIDVQSFVDAVRHAGYEAEDCTDTAVGLRDEDAAAALRVSGRVLLLALGLSIPAWIIDMFVGDFSHKEWLLCALTVPVWAIAGAGFHRRAWAALLQRTATMDTLVTLGSTVALGYSIVATLIGQPTYYETASAIIVLISLGKYFESMAKGQSTSAMRALLALTPAQVRRRTVQGVIEHVPIETLVIGDAVLVAAGERIPVDGLIIEGESALDVAALTGEPLPLEASVGTVVQSGSIVLDGSLVIEATVVGSGTVLARIIESVRRAQGTTPPLQRIADRVAAIFVPIVLGLALLTFFAWVMTGHTLALAMMNAIAVLVVACPCALGLATPTAMIASIGAAAAAGLLVRDAAALEQLSAVDIVLFDKTGTLTVGRPTVIDIVPCEGYAEHDILSIAASLEYGSVHPLAQAIVRLALERHLPLLAATSHVTKRGKGLQADIAGKMALLGTPGYLREHDILCTAVDDSSYTNVSVAHGGHFLGNIRLADVLRPQAQSAIDRLQALGLRSEVVSGDGEGPTSLVASSLGITAYYARISPEGKAALTKQLQEQGAHVAFVGDGINDAPALAAAEVGIALGSGTDIAMDIAKVVILSGDIRKIADAIVLSRATMRTIHLNLCWAFAYNIVLIPLAAFGFVYPVYAAAAMGLSSLCVVANSLLLRRVLLKRGYASGG